MACNMFPYSNLHSLNLDWILAQIKATETLVELFRGQLNGITLRLNQLENTAQQLAADAVRFTEQSQTAERQQQARSNIGAASAIDLQALNNDLQALTDRVDDGEQSVLYNGQSTISTVPNKLTVEGANEGDYSVLGGGFLRLYEALSGAGVVLTCDPDTGGLRVGPVGLPGGRARISNVDDPVDGSDAVNKDYVDDGLSEVATRVQQLTGITPTISAPANNTRYTAGVLEELTLATAPAGIGYSIEFTSGSTPTVTMFPAAVLGLETFAAEANTIYEINILDNRALVASWAVTA